MKKIIYETNENLPKNVKSLLPDDAQTLFRETINRFWVSHKNIAQATKGAWEEVKRNYSKKADGYWYKNE